MKRFRQQMLHMTTRMLQLMKGGFDAFADTGQQGIEGRRVLAGLVSTLSRPDAVTPSVAHLRLPQVTDEAFIGKDGTVAHAAQHTFGCHARIGVGGNQVVHQGQAIERGLGHQFEAKVNA